MEKDGNNLTSYQNDSLGVIRVTDRGQEPWFVAMDICNILDTDISAIRRLDDDEKAELRLTQTSSNGVTQTRTVSIISEAGVYALVLSSRKPDAKAFKRWLTHEVLPEIRRSGLYALPTTVEAMLHDPETMVKVLTALQEERKKNAEQEKKLRCMEPKAAYFDRQVAQNQNISFTEFAKETELKRRDVINYLLQNQYVFRDTHGDLTPFDHAVEEGLLVIRESGNPVKPWRQTLVTPKGKETFKMLMKA